MTTYPLHPSAAFADSPPPLLGTWVATPIVTTVMVLATVAYLVATVVARRRGNRWSLLHVGSWVIAMALLVVALNSCLRVLADHLFWAHMVVHLMLITVVPLFLVLAQPIRLTAATGARVDRVLHAILGNVVVRVCTSPILGLPLYAGVLVGTHLTGFQDYALAHSWAQNLEYLLYLVAGWLFMLPLIGDELCGHRLSHPLRFASFLVSMGPDTLVGVTLMMTSSEIAPRYALSHPGWGPSGLSDQSSAGAIMWFGGDGLMMILLLVVAWLWISAEGVGDRRDRGGSMGTWLDSARRGALLGDAAGPAPTSRSDGAGGEGTDTDDIDADDAALAAYNARLQELNRRQQR
ncbi:cytochrome c oxidase assembly protein [Tsukamurella soli]|uniref:Copper resistance protein D n=1 Tax=Tsukamurella soli TaxID=644556 RepID=A0ABP8J017_9ACTN